MQRCGICRLISSLLNRAVCGARRSSSSDSLPKEEYEELNKLTDQLSDTHVRGELSTMELRRLISENEINLLHDLDLANDKALASHKFLTIHKKRRKRLSTRSLQIDVALLDDILHGQVKCILNQSAYWKFNAFILENVSGGRSLPALLVHLFHWYGLLETFNLDVASVWKLFSLIEEGYHSTNPYHNSIHATDVTQAMHCFLQQDKIRKHLEPVEILASLIGAVAHDVDHPGVNQPFLIATSNHLAALYQNSSVLENHHWRSAIGCIMESGISEQLSGVWPQLSTQISTLILATDITRQQEFLTQFKAYIDGATLDMGNREHRLFILQIALKCADISNPCRTWDISKKWSLKVCEEFFRQGDYERKLNLPITSLCDRHTTSIPRIQTGFLKFVVTPLMSEWHRFLQSDLSEMMITNLEYNQNKWEMLASKEAAEETQTEISNVESGGNDGDDDDDDDSDDDDISNSAELLIPGNPPSPASNQPSTPSEVFNALRRRFSAPAPFRAGQSCNQRRESLPIVCRFQMPNASTSFVEEDETSPKDSEISFRSLLRSKEHSIATMSSALEANRLNFIIHGSGSKVLQRQQTFPPVQPFNRIRYLSAAGEMPSCVEALRENSSPSDGSPVGSSSDVTRALIETPQDQPALALAPAPPATTSFNPEKTDNDSETPDAELKQGSSESLLDKNVADTQEENPDAEGKKMSLDVANNLIFKRIQQRRGSAPCDTYSEFKKSNFYFAVNVAHPKVQASEGTELQSVHDYSDNVIWCRWVHRTRCDHSYSYAKTKRRGSLPVEVLAMTGNICH